MDVGRVAQPNLRDALSYIFLQSVTKMGDLHLHFLLGLLSIILTIGHTRTQEYSYHTRFRGQDVPGQKMVTTDGEGGVECGNQLFKCGKGAVCSQNGECICPPGTRGDPKFQCVSDDYYISHVTGDPRLTGFDGMTAHVSYPCRVRLTHIKTRHNLGNKGGTCQLEIHVINFHHKDGYYILGFDLKGSITDDEIPVIPGHFTLRVFGFGENGTFVFKTQGNVNSIHHMTPWGAPPILHYMDNMVQIEYDNVHNMAVVIIQACGIMTTFRPQTDHSHQKPGFLVAVKKGPWVKFPRVGFPIASSPFDDGDPWLIRTRRALQLTKAEAVLVLAVSQQTYQDFGDSSMSCYIATRESTVMCPTFRQRAFAIKHCGFLYIESAVSSCLKANAFGESTGSIFAMCVQAMCLGHTPLCEVVRSQLEHYNCPISPLFSALSCRDIRRKMLQMYPHTVTVP